MSLSEIAGLLNAILVTAPQGEDPELEWVLASDLMSDVLSFGKDHSLLLTSLTNQQVVRIAEITEISAICFVNGKQPRRDAIELADKKAINLLVSPLSMFSACGKLYGAGLGD